jgi:hypothetical protein
MRPDTRPPGEIELSSAVEANVPLGSIVSWACRTTVHENASGYVGRRTR